LPYAFPNEIIIRERAKKIIPTTAMTQKKPWNWPPDSRTHRILFFIVLIIILAITLKILANQNLLPPSY
jgi:hypothetical protein